MKFKYLKSLLIITFIFIATSASAQSGGIYCFYFRINPVLTDYIKEEDKSRKWLSGYSEGEAMPDQLLDSIKLKTEKAFTNKLKIPVKLCYHKNKKGEEISYGGGLGGLEGLPSNTFNMGKNDCPQNSLYIYLDVNIYPSEGSGWSIGSTKTKKNIQLQITTKVVDENKNMIWKEAITIKDFSQLRSETIYYGSIEITNSEVLTPFDIYAMYMKGLDELMKK